MGCFVIADLSFSRVNVVAATLGENKGGERDTAFSEITAPRPTVKVKCHAKKNTQYFLHR